MIVGQNDEAALGVSIATLLSLAAQFARPPRPTPCGQGRASSCSTARPKIIPMPGVLAKVAGFLAARRRVGDWRERVAQFSPRSPAELTRRQESKTDGPELFLFIHDLPRFRDLRRREDDFSFSSRERMRRRRPTTSMRFSAKGRSWAST